jgi:putative transposase
MLVALVVLLRSLRLICSGHRPVALENMALRQQLAVFRRTVRRPPLRSSDRLFWVLLAKAWQEWRTALIVVQPDTVVRWHRQWLGRRWTQRSTHTRPGRPSTAAAIRTLVDTMGAANPLWGAPRIHGELGKLGIDVSERTVSRLLRRRRRPPSQTWRTFLTNHVTSLVSMDFFTVQTLTGRVLFVLVLLAHQRRRVVHLAITEHPTAAWTAQQIIEAFPDDRAPRWLVRDRDAIYGEVFRRRVAGMRISEVVSAPSSPWQNPYVERLIGSLRRECLDHVIILSQRHLRRVLARYVSYYHGARTHLSLEKDAPTPRRVQAATEGRVVAFAEVGGLHHRYERRAA